jgi:hypothetical protein
MFSRSEIEQILKLTLSPGDESDHSVMAGLKYLRKIDFPEVQRAGRGKHAHFEQRHLLELAVALAVGQLGFPPKRAIEAALKASAEILAFHSEIERAFLCITDCQIAIESQTRVEKLIAEKMSVAILNLKMLLSRLRDAIATVSPPDDYIQKVAKTVSVGDMAAHVLKERDDV